MRSFLLLLLLMVTSIQCSMNSGDVTSPDKRIQVSFSLEQGVPVYSVTRDYETILKPSRLGFQLKNGISLADSFRVAGITHSHHDSTWEQVWGEQRLIRNHYNEMKVDLVQENSGRQMAIVFRVFNDGIGFRYEFPQQENLNNFVIADELTEFAFDKDHAAWWIPVYQYHRYEYLFKRSPLSELDTVHTPLTMETADGLYLSLHEADLTDYASMTLVQREGTTLKCDLVPWHDGNKVYASTPFNTPWRTMVIAQSPGDLITSYLVLNLNRPSEIEDTSWIRPGKYVGIWWGMHIGSYTWGSGPQHGATTANAKKYIDFATEHGFDGVLIEGWNTGWDGDWYNNGSLFRFSEPHPDFDMDEVSAYAKEKGVYIIGHHETGADIGNYERQMDAAFEYYKKYDIPAIKTGYVGSEVIDAEGNKQWHHGQYMVRHYRKVVKKAAEHRIVLDVHEPIKDTGIRRTWPNMMTREGARGQEFNAWSEDGGNPPEHETIIPFTRGLAGPFDFTPGIFDLTFEELKPDNRVNTTLAKQLAIYVTYYSPLHMAADLPENYEGEPAFQFIKDVPTDWETTKVLNGEIGEYLTIARQDRNSKDWYLGSVTDENPRDLTIRLDFLEPGKSYTAQIYRDADDADWETNSYAMAIEEKEVNSTETLQLKLAPGGGQAIRFIAE